MQETLQRWTTRYTTDQWKLGHTYIGEIEIKHDGFRYFWSQKCIYIKGLEGVCHLHPPVNFSQSSLYAGYSPWKVTHLNTLCTHSVHTLNTLCTHSVHTLYSLCTHSVHTLYTLCTHSVHTLYTLCTHSVHTLYSLCTHSVLEERSVICVV